ncbi:MAG TPA: hypothetical protein H9825_14260 [Candidatus Sphingobacterium stercorigallinarum]|nr:hypothetical protein [Candidatus Sphingobacterium stercorigallinarum]
MKPETYALHIMDLNRNIQYRYEGQNYEYAVIYNLQDHSFDVTENQRNQFKLVVNPQTKVWSTQGGEASIPVEVLAKLVQQSYGVFV